MGKHAFLGTQAFPSTFCACTVSIMLWTHTQFKKRNLSFVTSCAENKSGAPHCSCFPELLTTALQSGVNRNCAQTVALQIIFVKQQKRRCCALIVELVCRIFNFLTLQVMIAVSQILLGLLCLSFMRVTSRITSRTSFRQEFVTYYFLLLRATATAELKSRSVHNDGE